MLPSSLQRTGPGRAVSRGRHVARPRRRGNRDAPALRFPNCSSPWGPQADGRASLGASERVGRGLRFLGLPRHHILSRRNVFSHSSRGQKSQIRVPSGFAPAALPSPTLPPYFLPLPAPTRQGSEVEPLPCPSRSFWTVAGRPRRPVAGGCVTPVTSVLDSLSPPL